MRKLFALMTCSDKKYVDPTFVLNSIVNDEGKVIAWGEQKDIGEVNIQFISRIEEGIRLQQKYQQRNSPLRKTSNDSHDSSCVEIDQEEQYFQVNPTSYSKSFSISSQMFNLKNQNTAHLWKDFPILLMARMYLLILPYLIQQLKKQKSRPEQSFSTLYLDLQQGDLYSSLDATIFSQIDEFQIDEQQGVKVQALKCIEILFPPLILMFQLQRVYFDKNQQKMMKNNQFFDFDTEIYIDRFLKQNIQQYKDVRIQVNEIKSQIKELQNQIFELKKNDHFSEILNLLQIQLNKEQHPLLLDYNQKLKLPESIQTIKELCTLHQLKINQLNMQIENLQQQVNQNLQQFSQNKYRLFTIMIHEGSSADIGHYYTFIFDANLNKWRQYNDINVTEVSEDFVLCKAKGGNLNDTFSSAYYIVYIQNQMLQEQLKFQHNLVNFGTSKNMTHSIDMQEKCDIYTSLVKQHKLYQEVSVDNMKFVQDLNDKKNQKTAKLILQEYQNRYNQVREQERLFQNQKQQFKILISLPCMKNFAVFLKTHTQNSYNTYDSIWKFHLLSQSLNNFFKEKKENEIQITIYDIINNQMLEGLKNSLKSQLFKLDQNKQLQLTIEHGQYQSFLQQYSKIRIILQYMAHMLQNLLDSEFQLALQENYICIQLLNKEINQLNQQIVFVCRDIAYVIILRLFTSLEQLIIVDNNLFFQNLGFIVQFLYSIKGLQQQDYIQQQIQNWIKDICSYAQKQTKDNNFVNKIQFQLTLIQSEQMLNNITIFKEIDEKHYQDSMHQICENEIYSKSLFSCDLVEQIEKKYRDFRQQFQIWVDAYESIMSTNKLLSFKERKKRGISILKS